MKRFYEQVTVEAAEGGWQVALDGRRLKTPAGAPQIVPTRALAEALAEEWRLQPQKIDPRGLPMRDMADYAIDRVRGDRAATIAAILNFAETDTLCYRADPGDPLRKRQDEWWDALLAPVEARLGARFERIDGIGHRPQPRETLAAARSRLEGENVFTLAALQNLSALAASLAIAFAAVEPEADGETLFAAANLEEDWQAVEWGWDSEALARRDGRLAGFLLAQRLALLAVDAG